MRMIKSDWILLITIIIICCNLNAVELKRSFGIGRSRPKVGNPSVRRRTHTSGTQTNPEPQHSYSAPSHKSSSKADSESVSKPKGPPPAYSANPSNAKSSSSVGAPPPYSPSHAVPPSYSAAMGNSNPSSNLNYPRQTYGVNSGVNTGGVYSSHPNYGTNTGFGQAPYNNLGGYNTGHNGMSASGFSSGYGGYNGFGGSNYGNPGGGFGGFGGGMPMGGYGYAPKQSSSLFTPGNLLTGLAVWQLARGIGGSYGHNDHVYHVYHTNPQQQAVPAAVETVPQNINTQTQLAAPSQPDTAYAANIPNVTPSAEVTPVPDTNYQYEFSTIHPSLFPYGRYDESLSYWANPNAKAINTTADATDSIITTITTSTTPIPN